MPPPRVTVLLATYNQAETLAAALESVVDQTLDRADYEVVVVNDGSTDGTSELLARYGAGIRLLEQPNRGLVPAVNRGLATARGKYFARIDSDDEVDREWLACLLSALEAEPDAVCAIPDRVEFSDPDERRMASDPGNVFSLIACGTLFRTDAIRAIGGYRPLYWEEYDLYLRLRERGRFLHVPRPLYRYRRHGGSMTAVKEAREAGWRELLDAWGPAALLRAGRGAEMMEVIRETERTA